MTSTILTSSISQFRCSGSVQTIFAPFKGTQTALPPNTRLRCSRSDRSNLWIQISRYSSLSRTFRSSRDRGLKAQCHITLPPRATYSSLRSIENSNDKNKSQSESSPEPSRPLTSLPELPTGCPSDSIIADLFGPRISQPHGHYFLKALQFRRESGNLIEKGVAFDLYPQVTPEIGARALEWLRTEFPLNEEIAAKEWLSKELAKAEEEERQLVSQGLVERAEKWKIYKKDNQLTKELEDQGDSYEKIGRELSVLDALRRDNERRYEEQLEKEKIDKEKRVEEARAQGKELVEHDDTKSFWDGVVAKTPEQQAKQENQLKEGMVSQEQKPPEMTMTQRLLPSAIFTLIVLVGSVGYAYTYTPTDPSDRLLPSVPPSAATVLSIIAINSAIFLAWRRPEFWKFLNSYAIIVVGKPHAASMLVSVFSHTAGLHFIANMAALWAVGTRLHEIVPRGDFTALYLSTGVIASFGVLAQLALTKKFHMASLGASGAIWGILAAYLTLVPNGVVPYTMDWSSTFGWKKEVEVPAMSLLAALLLIDQALVFVPGMGMVGRSAHAIGAGAGLAGAKILQWRDGDEKEKKPVQLV